MLANALPCIMSSWEKVKGLSTEKNAKGVSPNNESLVSK